MKSLLDLQECNFTGSRMSKLTPVSLQFSRWNLQRIKIECRYHFAYHGTWWFMWYCIPRCHKWRLHNRSGQPRLCHWLLLYWPWNWSHVRMLSQQGSLRTESILSQCTWLLDEPTIEQWISNNFGVSWIIVIFKTAFTKQDIITIGIALICRYPDPNYGTRINYYSSSSPTVRFNSIATGNTANDNQALIMERRFLMAAVGNEATACPSTTAVGKIISPK